MIIRAWWFDPTCPKCNSQKTEPSGPERDLGNDKRAQPRTCKNCNEQFEAKGTLLRGN